MTALDYSQGCPVARKNRHRGNNDIITRHAKFGKFYCVWMSQVVQRSSKWIETKELVLFFPVMVAYQTVPICSWRHWISLWLIKYIIFSIKTIKVKHSSIALNSVYGCIMIRSSELHNDVSSSSGLIIIMIILFYFILLAPHWWKHNVHFLKASAALRLTHTTTLHFSGQICFCFSFLFLGFM